MMPPASAIAMRSATLTGNIENATAALPDETSRSSSAGAANAADEIDALVGARIADAEERLEHRALEHLDVEGVGARRAGERRRKRDGVPAAGKKHGDAVRGRTAAAAPFVVDPAHRPERGDERLGRVSVQILDRAVVRKDLRLIVGKRDGHEMIGRRRPGPSLARARAALAAR